MEQPAIRYLPLLLPPPLLLHNTCHLAFPQSSSRASRPLVAFDMAILLVDDGTCPAGQIKEVTGGRINERVQRTRRCIPRQRN
jgi:hypothetical protein